MRPASPAAVVLVAAFVVAAGALSFLTFRLIGAERIAAEQEVRLRLRAVAEKEAQRIAAAVARSQAQALTDSLAIVVRDGRFVAPVAPRTPPPLGDSGGQDRVGDALLAEAARLELEPTRVREAEAILRRLVTETNASSAAVHDAASAERSRDAKVAAWRLAALLARTGRASEAAAMRAEFLRRLDGDERTSLEGLFARAAQLGTADEQDSDRELKDDLLAWIGGADDGAAVDLLRSTGLADAAAIASRRAEVALLAPLQLLLPELVRRPRGAACDARGHLMAWDRTANGEQRLVECSDFLVRFADPPPKSDRTGGLVLGTGIDPRTPVALAPPYSHDDAWKRRLGDLREEATLPDLIPDVVVVAPAPRADVDAEAGRRARLVVAALVTLLAVGGGAVYFTLRAAANARAAAAARTAFIARVSHDLRTPLAVIRMYAETIADGRTEGEAQAREFAAVAAREAARLSALLGQVLDFSRASAARPQVPHERIDVAALVQEVVAGQRDSARAAGVELLLTVRGNDLFVRGDRAGLETAAANLIGNALQHGAAGGRVEIELAATADTVELAIHDRGPGLPSGLHERIFEPFVRGPQARPGGSGLGLALVREVARAHGGRARGEDRVGGGATFRFTLPRAAGTP